MNRKSASDRRASPRRETAAGAGAPKERSKRKDRRDTEQRLICAGIEVFSEFGFDGATTRKISEKSGVNESLIIRYFGSKQGLLIAIIAHSLGTTENTPLHYPPREDLESELSHYLLEEMKFMGDQYRLWRVIISRSWTDPEMLRTLKTRASSSSDPRLLERLMRLQRNGKIRADVDLERLCFQMGIQGFAIHVLLKDASGNRPDLTQNALFIAKIFAAGLSPH